MNTLIQNLKGDRTIWALVALLALISFIPVYSASSNLAYLKHGTGNTFIFLVKHGMYLVTGFFLMYQVQKIPYNLLKGLTKIFFLPLTWLLLIYVMFNGAMIDGANASRWISTPLGTFQPSAFAAIALYIFVARYLSKTPIEEMTFQESFIKLWIPVFVTLALILPSNLSTTALIFLMVLILSFVGGYPIKNSAIIVGMGIAAFAFFVLLAKAFPDAFPNRVDTWISRIENFTEEKPEEEKYQIEKAKTAIASGGVYGLGPGKSVQKHFLPQSSSDFIFAIIVEELGLLGAFSIIAIYLLLFFRFIVAAQKATNMFGKLLVVGLGFPIIFQAFINMGVAVELLPTTGQTLPLISSGGSSIWVTCIAIGIIINVTKKEEEIAQENLEKQKREEALQRLIDKELAEENSTTNEDYSIEEMNNPINAVLGK